MGVCLLTHSLCVPLKQLIPVKMSQNSLCIFIVSNLLSLLCFLVSSEIAWSVYTITSGTYIAGASTVCSLSVARCLFCLQVEFSAHVLFVLHTSVILSAPSSSISSKPNSTGPSPGTIKTLNLTTLSLSFNQTEQMPNCSMFEFLNIFKITELF